MFNKKLEINNQRGLTLIEIMAVVIIIGLLYAVVAKGIFGQSNSAKVKLNALKMEKLKYSSCYINT